MPAKKANGNDNDTRHDLQTILDAIRGEGRWAKAGKVTTSSGIIQTIATRLRVSRQTIYNYKTKWATVAAAIAAEREVPVELAENRLYEEVNSGNITAIIFLLKTRGKHLGYVEREEKVIIDDASGETRVPADIRSAIEKVYAEKKKPSAAKRKTTKATRAKRATK